MKRLTILFCALLFACGCAGDGGKTGWDEVMKDLRGDNRKMLTDRKEMKGGVWE